MSAKARCFQEKNPGAGFIAEHTRFCSSLNGGNALCEEAVAEHLHIGYWCGNQCTRHASKTKARHKNAVVSEPIFLYQEQ